MQDIPNPPPLSSRQGSGNGVKIFAGAIQLCRRHGDAAMRIGDSKLAQVPRVSVPQLTVLSDRISTPCWPKKRYTASRLRPNSCCLHADTAPTNLASD